MKVYECPSDASIRAKYMRIIGCGVRLSVMMDGTQKVAIMIEQKRVQ